MDQSPELIEELRTLFRRSSDLAQRLDEAAHSLRATGTFLDDDLIEDLLISQRNFASARLRVLEFAESRGIQPEAAPNNLADLELLAHQAVLRSSMQDAHNRALLVLNQVLSMTHVDQPTFPALAKCKEQALAVRDAIVQLPLPDVHPDTQSLADGTHPLAQLVSLVEGFQDLADEKWSELLEAVKSSWGVALAAAVSRSKLSIGRKPDLVALADNTPREGDPSHDEETGNSTAQPPAVPPSSPPEHSSESVAPLAAVSPQDPETVVSPTPKPKEEAQVRLRITHRTGLGDSAQSLAASLRASGRKAESMTPELTDLVWLLIGEDRMGLAFNLSRCVEALGADRTKSVPSWLVRTAAVGRHVHQATGELQRDLKEDFAHFGEECFTPGDSEGNHAVRLLLVAAALQPALLAPASGAAAILHALHRKEGFQHLYDYCQSVAQYGSQQVPLDPHALKGLKDHVAWQAEMDILRLDVEAWYTQAETATLLYAPATKVWRAWLEHNRLIYRLLQGVRSNNASALNDVRKEADRLSDPTEVRREVDDTDHRVLKRLGHEPITARALTQIVQHVEQAVALARRWIHLQESIPGREPSFLAQRAEQVRQMTLDKGGHILRELSAFEQERYVSAMAAACCRRTFESVQSLFAPDSMFTTAEADPRHLLYADLLRIPNLVFSQEWEPVGVDTEEMVIAVLDVISSDQDNWEKAFHAHADNLDHEATRRIIEYLETRPGMTPEVELLRRSREQSLAECQGSLKRRVISTLNRVEAAVSFGLLRESERAGWAARIGRIDVAIPTLERFQDSVDALNRIEHEIDQKKKAELEAVRQRLKHARIDQGHSAYQRILGVLEKGDVLTANEYIEMVRQGEEIPEAEHQDSFLRDFFPTKARDIEDAMGKESPAALVRKLRSQQTTAGIDMKLVTEKQAELAVDMMEAWFTAKTAHKVLETVARRILSGLGFNPERVDIDRSPRRTWLTIWAEPLHDKNRCPVAAYGSSANGQYRILCVWDRPTEEDLVNDVGDTSHAAPVLVLHFGPLTIQQRRSLARLCRERRRTFLVLDDTLMLYLCGVRGSRLPVMFECTLPFTFLEPYSITAGLVPPEVFYGREQERDSVISQDGSCFIYGGRQLGKTALLRDVERTFHAPTNGHIAVWIDLKAEGIGYDRSIDDIWNVLAIELKRVGVLPSTLPAHSNAERILENTLEWLNQDSYRRILLLLDEADRFLESDGKDEFRRSDRMKGLMEKTGRRFKVVFAGLHNVLRTTRQQNQPLAHYGEPLCIGPLLDHGDWRQARALVGRPLTAIGFEPESSDLVTRILSQTNYYPSLIQLYCNQLLRHFTRYGVASFDSKNSPPYIITSRQVEDAYGSQELRKAIRDRFMWTLQLDPRYEVVAHAIAYDSLANDKRGIVEGFPVGIIRREALRWWSDGFKDGAPEDSFRVLLDEMVGLGVLRVAGEGHYALRSPNVMLLMGTEEEIEAQLLRNREAPLEYEPGTFHSVLRQDGVVNPSRRSPLTAQQEAMLRDHHNGVSILFGCEAAGLSYLRTALECTFGKEFLVDLASTMDKQGFTQRLAELVKRERNGVTLVYVPYTCPWTDTWVDEGLQRVGKLKSKNAFVRLVFTADPNTTRRLVGQFPSGFDQWASKGITTFNLRPWHDAALRQWLDDNGLVPQDPTGRGRIHEVTGLWPAFLEQFYELSKDDVHSWENALQQLRKSLASAANREAWKQMLALDRREAHAVLHALVALGSASVDDLVQILEELPPDVIRQTLHWAEILGLARSVGEANWAVDDPVIRRLLETNGE